MLFVLTTFICTVVLWLFCFVWRKRKWILMCAKFHHDPWNLPGVGNAIVWTQGGEARMKIIQRFGKLSIKNGGLTSMWVGPKHFVVVADANIADILLKNCLAKDDVLNITSELFGYGSIFAPDHIIPFLVKKLFSVKIWRTRRKVIAPTFSQRNLNQFVEVFYEQSNTMVEQLKQPAGKGTFSIWKYLTTYTMDSVCETALGVNVDAQRHPEHPFIQAFDKHCKMSARRLTLPATLQQAYRFLPIYKFYMKIIYTMHDFVDDIINAKRKELAGREEKCEQNNNDDIKNPHNFKKTFLELFIESSGGSSGFTNKELREETLVLVLAGTDTSAVGSAFTCLMLARHPEVQDMVYEEIKEVLGDSKGPITPKDLLEMKYLEAVIKESLRLYPPVPIIVRKVENDIKLPSGQTLVAGTALLMNIWAIHRNPRYWGDDVDVFKPERFIGSADIHPTAFIPFSHGPRSCLGYQYAMMSMKTAVANLILHYRIHSASPVPDKNAPLHVSFDIMMKHVENFKLKLEARN